jgi:hypothetical protein
MLVIMMMVFVGVLLTVVGHYQRRIVALTENPVTKVRIVPRTLYDEQLGVDWTSESLAPAGREPRT